MMENERKKQRGITLLLSVLVMTAISTISFGIAAIVFSEIRTSGDATKTEPAVYANMSLLEEAIFKIKMNTPSSYTVFEQRFGNCDATQTTNITYFGSSLKSQICPRNLTLNYDDQVFSNYNTTLNTKNVYYIFNPLDPYAGSQADGSPDSGYSKISVENIGSSSDAPVDVYLCEFNSTQRCPPCEYESPRDPECVTITPKSINPGAVWESNVGDVVADRSYFLTIVNKGSGSEGYVRIKTWGTNPSTGVYGPLGLPLIGKQAVLVQSSLRSLTRRYKAIVPQ